MTKRSLDVICLGRSSVDLYGDQVGGPLEDMSSFSKYVGGCATNIAVGTSRLGLRSGLITRVGDEQMGRFIRQTLIDEGVDVRHVSTDPQRLTALVILGIRDRHSFPHIFYRENCADMALRAEHIDPDYIASAHALVLTGTHFSQAGVEGASRKALESARAAGTQVVLDIDYRPVAWGLTSHADGENRFVESEPVTRHLQSIVGGCDLIVGTEEEFHIAGGDTDTIAALHALRKVTRAAFVVKRGALGCAVFADEIPASLDDGISVQGREIEVFNTLGAGDGFMSGFLRGWIRGESWATSCTYGNASGALVVSRHGCSPAIPSWDELQHYLTHEPASLRLREDSVLENLHRATTGRKQWPEVCALAFDHRSQFEELADANGGDRGRISRFKGLLAQAANLVAGNRAGAGMIIDDIYGFDALAAASGDDWWIARPVELPGSRPLEFQHGSDIWATLHAWPKNHVVKCLVHYHPDDAVNLRTDQERSLTQLLNACRATGRELLLEVIPPENGGDRDDAVLRAVELLYQRGIAADWWKLPPAQSSQYWFKLQRLIENYDPHCHGVIILGLDAPIEALADDFAQTAGVTICKGFAVGRSLFNEPAKKWFSGEIDDREAIDAIAANFGELLAIWDARNQQLRQSAS